MSTVVLVLPANLFQEPRLQQVNDLEQMQELVGGYIEPVRVDWGRLTDQTLPTGVHVDRQATLYVNEEYRLIPRMPFNVRATLLYPWSGGILGDAFVAGPVVEDEDTDVPEEVIQYFLGSQS